MAQLVWMITGTTSGIGAALVEHIVARGDKVIASGRNAEQRIGHLKSDLVAVLELDICAQPSVISSQMTKAWETFGHIDVLINNAGMSAHKSVEETQDSFTANLFQANLFGHMQVTSAILPRFRAQGHGRIGFTSTGSIWGPLPFLSNYAAAKAALTTYAESLDKEVRPLGIRCVSFLCGGFQTSLGQPREADSVASSEEPNMAAYKPIMDKLMGIFMADPMACMPGDLAKLAAIIADIITGEGLVAGKPWAVNVALGSDAFHWGKQRFEQQLDLLQTWKDISFSTDRDGHDHAAHKDLLGFASMLEDEK